MNIYDIHASIQAILEIEESDLQKEALKNLEGALEDKADGFAKYIRGLECEIQSLDEEIKRLQDRKKSRKNEADRLKKILQDVLTDLDKKKIKTALFTFSVAKNRPSVKIVDESVLPDEYFAIERKPVKAKIQEGIESGEIPEEVAYLSVGESLRIR